MAPPSLDALELGPDPELFLQGLRGSLRSLKGSIYKRSTKGFRSSWFRSPGFRNLGFRGLGFRVYEFRV